jgi:hypothetical protein
MAVPVDLSYHCLCLVKIPMSDDPNLIANQLSAATGTLIVIAVNAQAFLNGADSDPRDFVDGVRKVSIDALKLAGYDDDMLEILGLKASG